MKCSLGISNFLEEISSLSHSVVFLYFFALIAEEGISGEMGKEKIHSTQAWGLQSSLDGSVIKGQVPLFLWAPSLQLYMRKQMSLCLRSRLAPEWWGVGEMFPYLISRIRDFYVESQVKSSQLCLDSPFPFWCSIHMCLFYWKDWVFQSICLFTL